MLFGVIRLISLDVDGTLVGSSGTVPLDVWTIATRVRAAGIRLAICSGRPAFGGTLAMAERLDPDGWHVFQNGASIVHLSSGHSMSTPLEPAAIELLVERARRTSRIFELYTDSAYAVESTDPIAREHARLLGVSFVARSFDSLEGPVVRAQWLLSSDEVTPTLSEPYPGLEVAASTSPLMPATTFVMITKTGVSKASALRAIAEKDGVPLAEVMHVGDGHNDIEAMAEVGFPVAMGNAPPEVHHAARFHVGHVDRGGLVEALEMALRDQTPSKERSSLSPTSGGQK